MEKSRTLNKKIMNNLEDKTIVLIEYQPAPQGDFPKPKTGNFHFNFLEKVSGIGKNGFIALSLATLETAIEFTDFIDENELDNGDYEEIRKQWNNFIIGIKHGNSQKII